MKFFSGFFLKNEQHFFEDFIHNSEYTVCGFSYGSLKALKYVQESLENSKRVDKLQLFSPIFFQTKNKKFKRLQLMSFKKDDRAYIKQFSKSCFAPYSIKELEFEQNTLENLQELLEYNWQEKELKELVQKGVKLEIYLGSQDKIIDVVSARDFFTKLGTLTYIKNANHFLQVD
jgi:alpha-beta hydrolase superfamily lysophospholipase